jgi:hypothetical protein
MTNLLIIVHTCQKYEQSRCSHILETWFQSASDLKNIEVCFWTDNEFSELPNSIYQGPYSLGATYHPSTVIKIFQYFLNTQKYDWLMLIDDDSYLAVDKLISYLRLFSPTQAYLIGDFVNWPLYRKEHLEGFVSSYLGEPLNPNDEYQLWPGGGPGLVFTKSSVINFLTIVNDQIKKDKYSKPPNTNHDVWLHTLLKSSSSAAIRVHCPGFHQYGNNEFFLDKHGEMRSLLHEEGKLVGDRLISVHLNGKIDQMHELHSLLSDDQKSNRYKGYGVDDGFELTNDWFHVAAIRDGSWLDKIPQEKPSKVLEIGSYEGASAINLIMNNDWTENMQLWCIDTWEGSAEHQTTGCKFDLIEARFNANTNQALMRAKRKTTLQKQKGFSADILPRLLTEGHKSTFDLIYVDGSHTSSDVLLDAVLSFQLLRENGLILFDDYLWAESLSQAENPIDFPRMGIDAFTSAFFGKIRIERSKLYQLWVRKTKN